MKIYWGNASLLGTILVSRFSVKDKTEHWQSTISMNVDCNYKEEEIEVGQILCMGGT